MRNLPLPSRDDDRGNLKKAIRRYKYGGVMRGHNITEQELDEVISLYDRYDESNAIPCDELKGNGMPASLCDAIYSAYDSTQEGRRLEAIRELIFKGVDLCPICGIDTVVELDHHLPRSVFKPLAIYTRNLVPMCHSCNHAKLAGFGEAEDSGFLHAYLDLLPDCDFVQAAVSIKDGGLIVEFGIDMNAILPDGYADRLTGQIQALELNLRYQDEVNAYISGHAVMLHLQHSTAGGEGVRSILQLQARYETKKFYRNHWRPVLLRSLAAHDPFVNGGFAAVLPLPQDIIDDMTS